MTPADAHALSILVGAAAGSLVGLVLGQILSERMARRMWAKFHEEQRRLYGG